MKEGKEGRHNHDMIKESKIIEMSSKHGYGLRVCYICVGFDDDFSESVVFIPHCTKCSPRLCPQAGFYGKLFVFIFKKIIIRQYCPTEPVHVIIIASLINGCSKINWNVSSHLTWEI